MVLEMLQNKRERMQRRVALFVPSLCISQILKAVVPAGSSRWLDETLPLLRGCFIRYLQTTSHPQVKG